MAEQDKPQEEDIDEGTSLEKAIDKLDKDDPDYAAKRQKLSERLQAFRQELDKTHKKIKKQQQETLAALKLLRRQAKEHPQNEDLQHLLAATELDKAFLTRAVAEVVSARGNLEQELKRLKSTQEFKQPLDLKILTDLKVRPLPSSRLGQRRAQTHAAVKSAHANRLRSQASIGRRILMLRQSTADRTTASRGAPRQRTRQG